MLKYFLFILLIFEISDREPWPDVSAELSARKAPEFLTKYILHYPLKKTGFSVFILLYI